MVLLFQEKKNKDLYEDWAFGGQSWVVGCQIPSTIKYPDVNELNEDHDNPLYSTPCGIYQPHCGLDEVLLSWSGAEYIYHFLKHNHTTLPHEALAIVRYLELDLWHSGYQYGDLANEKDEANRALVADFFKLRGEAFAALQTGTFKRIDLEAVWPSYQTLVDKYLPPTLEW